MKKQMPYIIIVALIVLQLYSLAKINSLQNRIDYINDRISSVQNGFGNQINSIYQNVDEKLEAKASLIHKTSVKVGTLDVDTFAVPITFTIEPKSITETMSVALDFDGEIVQLEKSGLKYSTTKNFEISDRVFPKIIMADNGIKNIEEHNGLQLSNIKEQVFPHIYAHFSGESSYSSNHYRAKGILVIDYKPSQENNSFVDVKYVTKVDDEIINEMPVVLEKEDGFDGNFTHELDDNYSINDGQILTFNIVAVDNLGFTHEYLVTHFVAGSNMQREPYFEKVNIIAPNGESVYLFDESNQEKTK